MQDDMDAVGYREIPKGALEAYLGELVGYQGYQGYQGGSWEKICEGYRHSPPRIYPRAGPSLPIGIHWSPLALLMRSL